ncbi:uncharacterized protein EI90DRAFT_3041420 [Cantharellus anzutake]|uniref:uncharacterized protein n=1 Tax=Cantharellus anzutake TaxID=1750568 RepID=UPI00190593DC|nr:uncharacterized protein EI90DRAFT_3041420 [Cantharellus anzutake]KAF8338049.1 hypothetical protein EI90DRAFT_3041420 [Cantharellus anzutake]
MVLWRQSLLPNRARIYSSPTEHQFSKGGSTTSCTSSIEFFDRKRQRSKIALLIRIKCLSHVLSKKRMRISTLSIMHCTTCPRLARRPHQVRFSLRGTRRLKTRIYLPMPSLRRNPDGMFWMILSQSKITQVPSSPLEPDPLFLGEPPLLSLLSLSSPPSPAFRPFQMARFYRLGALGRHFC